MKNVRLRVALAILSTIAMLPVAASVPVSAQAPPAPGASPQLVILDTDIGDDIDDAFALALVLRSPELRLLGVETAFADTQLRARLVDRYLAAVSRKDIPVLAGVPGPPTSHFSQAAYARQSPDQKHGDAVQFLLDQIRAHPGDITLIAIGPLTNLKAAIAKDPATFRKLKRVVIMGGSVYRGYNDRKSGSTRTPPSPEWNIVCDPAAAKALFGAGVPLFVMPLDSTQIRLQNPALAEVLAHGSALTDQLTLLYHQWVGTSGRSPTLFDPVAVTYTLRPDLCPATPLRLEVNDKGFTRPVPGAPNAQVCLHANEKGILEFLTSRITN
jgi:inosine-uridine nucleoside N-ribohydrolase